MTCLQEILLRVVSAIAAVREGRSADADVELGEIERHLASHGAVRGAELTDCRYEESAE